MKKILIILFCLPLFVSGQDIPTNNNSTTDLKITNKKTRDKLKKKIEKDNEEKEKDHKKSLKMKPKGQLGYIVGPEGSPWGGISWFLHGNSVGAYIDWRPSGNWLNLDNMTGVNDGFPGEYTGEEHMIWTSVTNYGLSFKIYSSARSAIMIYAGYGTTKTKTYDVYEHQDGYWYYEAEKVYTEENYNFGILRQTKSIISWQIGYDTALEGLCYGMGIAL